MSSMFSLSLRFRGSNPKRNFQSIDYRRLMGLRVDSMFETNYFTKLTFPVSESFARAWFDGLCSDTADVSLEWLIPGELKDSDSAGTVLLNVDDEERAKELYIRGKFEQLKNKLDG